MLFFRSFSFARSVYFAALHPGRLIIHQPAPQPRSVNNSSQPGTRVWSDRMTVMQQARVNSEIRIGIKNDQIGILPGRNPAFAARNSGQLRGRL